MLAYLLSNYKNPIFIGILGAFIGAILGWKITYNHYHVKELKASVTQQQVIIKQLNENLIKSNNQILISNKISESNINQITEINIKYNKIQKDLSDAKNSINSLNVIRGNLLRYIHNATVSNLQQVSPSSTGAYAATTTYSAYDFTTSVVSDLQSCEKNTNQLTQLQNWIKLTTENFNK